MNQLPHNAKKQRSITIRGMQRLSNWRSRISIAAKKSKAGAKRGKKPEKPNQSENWDANICFALFKTEERDNGATYVVEACPRSSGSFISSKLCIDAARPMARLSMVCSMIFLPS